MYLDSLAEMDRRSARGVIAKVLSALLAAGAATNDAGIRDLSSIERGVVHELASKAKVNLEALRQRDVVKLLELANDALITIATGDPKPKDIKNKLGDAGILAPSQYDAQPTNTLGDTLRLSRLSKREALDVVRYPDAYQHLFPPAEFAPEAEFVSIFVRLSNKDEVASTGGLANWLLVVGGRKGKTINMQTAFRLFESDLRIDAAKSSPLDLLEAFAFAFGNDIRLGNENLGKFCLYKSLPGIQHLPPFGLEMRRGFLNLMFRFNTKRNVTEIATAFNIDKDRYEGSLREHGVLS